VTDDQSVFLVHQKSVKQELHSNTIDVWHDDFSVGNVFWHNIFLDGLGPLHPSNAFLVEG